VHSGGLFDSNLDKRLRVFDSCSSNGAKSAERLLTYLMPQGSGAMSLSPQSGLSNQLLLEVMTPGFPEQPYCVRHAATAHDSGSGQTPVGGENAADFSGHEPFGPEVLAALRRSWPNGDEGDDADDPLEDEDSPDDESDWPSAPAQPTIRQRRELLVERGDFAAIYQQILDTPWHAAKYSDAFAQVLRAIDVASCKDPARLSGDLLRLMVNVSGYLMLRVQYTLLLKVRATDGETYSRLPDIPADVMEMILGHFASMQSNLAELCQSEATTARLWQLARQKELENKHRTPKRRRKRRLPGETAARATRGKPSNGVLGAKRGNGSTSNGVAALSDNGKERADTP
jgi:hypothetical protein